VEKEAPKGRAGAARTSSAEEGLEVATFVNESEWRRND